MTSSNYAKDPTGRSTARYGHQRLACTAGYHDVTSIRTEMTFELRHIPNISSRIVKVDGRTFELWSPNSTQMAFLPGERRADYQPTTPVVLTERRYDGHTGRHDCLFFPQYLHSSIVHWPFMRRATKVRKDDLAAAAFVPLMDHWVCEEIDLRRGRFKDDLIDRLRVLLKILNHKMDKLRAKLSANSVTWEARPRQTDEIAITRLLGVRRWEEAVDLGVAVQRGLREKEGWIAYIEARFSQRGMDLSALQAATMPLANEQFIGCWINGASEESALRHLFAGIPCFIAHEYAAGQVTRNITYAKTPVYGDMLEGTDVIDLLHAGPYQRLARENPLRLDAISLGDDGRGWRKLVPAQMELLSSSLYLEEKLEAASAALALSKAALRIAEASSSPPPPTTSPAAADTSALQIPSAPNAKKDQLAHRELSYRTIDPDRVPWVIPPPIQSVRSSSEKWSKWELDSFQGAPAWVLRGRKRDVGADNMWHDRERRRFLLFGSFSVPLGVVEEGRFGAPVPRFPFLVVEGSRATPKEPSYWMYRSQAPARLDAGVVARPPHPNSLPLLSNVRDEGAPGCVSKGKGKGKERKVYEDDDEDEDLGEHGMDVDEPDPRDAPSNVVVIDHLDANIDALMFRGLAADALYSCKVKPLVILCGQGRMWLRFGTTTEGRKAFGALGSIAEGLEVSYSPDAVVDEVARYTRDIWLPETTAGVNFAETREAPLTLAPVETSVPSAIDAAAVPQSEDSPTASHSMDNVQGTRTPSKVWGAEQGWGPERAILTAQEEEVDVRALSTPSPSPASGPSVSVAHDSPIAEAESPPMPLPAAVVAPQQPLPPPISESRAPPVAPRAMRGIAPKPSLTERLTDSRPSPLLRRLSGVVVPLEQRLLSPRPPLVERIAPRSTPLAERLSERGSQANLSSPLSPARLPNPHAGPSTRPPPHVPLTPRSPDDQDNEGSTEPKRKKKVRRGTRAGCIVKEMARLRAESSARASQSETEAGSSAPMETSVADVAEDGSSSQMDTEVTLTMLSPDEMEVTMADVEEAMGDNDEEMVDARWTDEDDEDRPVAGPSR
ncbi:hypothetical protein B0H13DRAFT_1909573 [Mycena leptocephala]|nr:hypothetical protein B0H13DRAFT_1909573 [Mycena leptocephala]